MADRMEAVEAPDSPNHRPEAGMHRRPTTFLLLHLILGVSGECASAGQDRPAEHAESEVVQHGQEPALERSDRDLLPHAGKRVRRILVRNLDVFGPSVEDTTRPPESRLGGILNRLNFRTRETTVRGNLLFREGDAIDPFRLADSERILRNLAFIGDARILVVPIPESADSVDVRVIVKESWTLELSQSLKEDNRFKASLAEENLLGLGHEVSVATTRTPDARPRWGFETSYSVQNIRGSFISAKLEYGKVPGKETAALTLSRELVSPVLRYAGGLELRKTSFAVPDSLPSVADNSSDLVDLWAGRPVHEWRNQREAGRSRKLFVSGRVRRLAFTRRPPVSASTFSQYHNVDHALGSLTYAQSRYYRTNLLYHFGRTEDVPHGFLARVTYGLADGEFARHHYAAATLAAGEKVGGLGYGVGELRIGGYPEGGEIQQGVIRLRSLYFSNLLRLGGFRFRQFVKAEYIHGIHRHADDSIDFNGDESIRGAVYDRSVTGSERLQLNLESVAFTPWRTRGVTYAIFTFADLDIIGAGRRNLFSQDYYSGLGLGVRLHKDGFGIGPVQLRFAWYPRLPIDHDPFAFSALAKQRFQPIELLGIRPEIVEY
jgi:hypothetical protein